MNPPLIIIGAGRSGTNALRDALCSMAQFHTWPCDEINYIWRSGNRDHPTDELMRTHATADVTGRIRAAFEKRARVAPDATVVEKTCANSLRVGFVDEVVPDARFVHLGRDGRDVTSSAMQRWAAPIELGYLLRKARFVPRRDLPHYALRYLRSRVAGRTSDGARVSTWGPRFTGLDELVASGAPLEVVCATQWAACVERSIDQLAEIDAERVHHVDYDALTAAPSEQLAAIVEFCGLPVDAGAIDAAAATLRGGSAGAWRDRLTPAMLERIEPIVAPAQARLEALR